MDRGQLTARAAPLDAQHLRFAVDGLHAVSRVRVIAQELRTAATALLLDGLEHARHLARVVAGARHHLRTEEVGLALVFAAVLQEVGAEPDLRSLGDDGTGAPADDGAKHLPGERAELELLALGRLRGAVPQHDVRELVRHDAGDLAFGGRRLNHPAVQEHRPARQRERIDLAKIDDVERVPELGLAELRRDLIDQAVADPLDEILGAPVVEERHLLPDLCRRLLPELDVLLG